MSDGAKLKPVRWDVPSIDGGGGQMTAGALQDLQKQAYDEAFELGRQDGIAAGAGEVKRRAERFDELLTALTKPFETLDDEIERQVHPPTHRRTFAWCQNL